MPKRTTSVDLGIILLDRDSEIPLYQQLYEGLRSAILDQSLTPGTRLPSTRTLATDLDISRNTVVNAYDQLFAEGYLDAEVGSGTHVAETLPDDLLRLRNKARSPNRSQPASKGLSQRGSSLTVTEPFQPLPPSVPKTFKTGIPDISEFPIQLWTKLTSSILKNLPPGLLEYGNPVGYQPLCEAIAAYIRIARGVRCTPEQVIIVSGTQQALDIASRLLLDPGDTAWVEDPGYLVTRDIFQSAGIDLAPIPVDGEGIDISYGIEHHPYARIAYVSPSHQHPVGVTMSLSRRLEILEWANRTGAWILEDDYDSEFRYSSQPISSLQGLDHGSRVIYMGTFSKVIFPSLRLGYLVVPPELIPAFTAAKNLVDRQSATLSQAVLASFISEGHFARHIRRMRMLYQERLEVLLHSLDTYLSGIIEPGPAEAGMHLVGYLPPSLDDRQVSQVLRTAGIYTIPLSACASLPLQQGGLVLGYAACNPAEIRQGARRMRDLLQQFL